MNIDTTNKNRLLSGQKEIAAYLGVSIRSLQRHLKTLPFSRIGNQMIILESDMKDWIRRSFTPTVPKKGQRVGHLSEDYQKLLLDIKSRIRIAQQEALKMVNQQLTALYYEIGQIIIAQKKSTLKI